MKIKEQKIDPRVKLIIVLCVSTLGIIVKDLIALSQILLVTILMSFGFGVDLRRTIRKLKRLIYVLLSIAIVQSVFSTEGSNIIAIGRLTILTTHGLQRGLEFILRMMIIVFSASLLTTSNSREIIQGFVQWGMPYDMAFMVAVGIRFLPIMTEEIKDSLIAIQLRGIELDNIPIKERLHIYSYIFTPIVIGTISKAEKLSTAIEMRGFRAYDNRTSYMTLKMSTLDYKILFASIVATVLFIIYYILKFDFVK